MSRNPVIVFAGKFWAGASGSGLSTGLRELGYAVQEVDQRDFGMQPGKNLFFRVFAKLDRALAAELYREKIINECRALKPDIFLTIKGVGVTTDLLQKIKETGARTVMYYPDFHFEHTGVSIDSFKEYDLFITTKSFQMPYLIDRLGNAQVAYVPHGYSASVHRPNYAHLSECGYRTDVLHAGNHSAYKQRWLETAAAALPELAFRLIGNRWRDAAGIGPLSRCDMPGERIGIAYAEAIQTARINVAVHMGATASGWQDLVSTRTFEIPACRGFMLHIDNDEVREFFEPGEEIDVFASPEELADKIRFYLARPELRAQMIDRAYQRCVPAYSYGARARQIAALLGFKTGHSAP